MKNLIDRALNAPNLLKEVAFTQDGMYFCFDVKETKVLYFTTAGEKIYPSATIEVDISKGSFAIEVNFGTSDFERSTDIAGFAVWLTEFEK
jgi:hypothetical protein